MMIRLVARPLSRTTAKGTQEVSANILGVTDGANRTRSASQQALGSAVQTFLTEVRAA